MRLRRLGARHFLAQPIVDIFAGGLLASFAMVRLYSAIARLAGGPSTPLLGSWRVTVRSRHWHGRHLGRAVIVMAIPALLYLSLALPASAGTDHSTSSVHWIAPGGLPGAAIPGASSTLVRNSSGASMTLQTSGLGAGTAATVWWVIFNNPENCVGPCSDDDKFRVAVNASVLYAAGHGSVEPVRRVT